MLDQDNYTCLDEIIETLLTLFKDKRYSKLQILEALQINSMNLINTYEFLLSKENGII